MGKVGKKKSKGSAESNSKISSFSSPKVRDGPDKSPKNDLYSQIFTNDSESESDGDITSTARPENKKTKPKAIKETQLGKAIPKVNVGKRTILQPKDCDSSSSEDDEDEGVEYDDDDDQEELEQDESVNDEEDKMDDDDEADFGEGQESESEDSDSDESESESDERKTTLRKQLKDLSFEELEALKQKMGLKEYNEAMFGTQNGTGKKLGIKNPKRRKFERGNKNRPREMSSKVRVPKLREIVKVPKKVRKDPRFDDAYGEFNERWFNTDYSFLRDLQKKEAEELKKKLKTVKDAEEKQKIKRFIQKVTDKEKSIAMKEKESMKRKQVIEENKKRVEEGKRPYYVKKSTQKLQELVEKYDELKSSGRLEKYLKKKRKKNAIRDRKSLKPIK